MNVAQVSRADQHEQIEIRGTLERVLVNRGVWGIVQVRRPNNEIIKAKGPILPLPPQSEINLKGCWQPDSYNPGTEIFDAQEVEIEQVTTRRGLIAKISDLPHVGRKRAMVLVETFGDDPKELFKILREQPDLVSSRIPGLTYERAIAISQEMEAAAWSTFAEVEVKLLTYLPSWMKKKAVRRWPGPPETKEAALDILFKDPYRLIEINGIGFKRADKAARDVGIAITDPRRSDAALEYVLEQAAFGDGHTWVSLEQASKWAELEKIEAVGYRELEASVERSIETGRVVADADRSRISHRILIEAEWMITKQARVLAQEDPIENAVYHFESASDRYGLNQEQRQAVWAALHCRLLILTGGPGTGKTYTLQAILSALSNELQPEYIGDQPIRLCAPTGKAARRMSEVTQRESSTVHRLLQYKGDFDAFVFGDSNPLPVRLVVCDEASMLDSRLAGQLFSAIDPNNDCRLILVGDVDQLPSVGPGKVLHDLIESQAVPVVRLNQVMRQAENSAITTNAHALINGDPILIDNDRYADFKVIEVPEREVKREEREDIAENLLWAHRYVCSELGHSPEEVQVLSPQKNGEVGTGALNRALRNVLNPQQGKPEIEVVGQKRAVRLGDRVIQTRNDYDLEVMNGEMGTVMRIESPDPDQAGSRGAAIVQMDDARWVRYPTSSLGALHLAYAITVHKSQGSEWPVVIIPVTTSHAATLSRRLLYTAITRGKKLVVLIGTAKALRYAQKNIRDAQRQTRLLGLLGGG